MIETPPDIILYGRPGCHLCEDARAAVSAVLAHRRSDGLPTPALVERNIDDDDELHRRYLLVIPVLAAGGRELELATTTTKVVRFLAELLDGAPAHEGAA